MILVLFVICLALFILMMRTEKRLMQRIERLQTALDHMQAEWDRARVPAPAPEPVSVPPPAAPSTPAAPEPRPVDLPETLADILLPPETPTSPAEAVAPVADPAPGSPQPTRVIPAEPFPRSWTPAPRPLSPWAERWQAFVSTVDWEQFTGVKLFAWLGGLALFVAAGFFVKFSIDRNLIPPALRLAVSAFIGMGLIVGAGRFGEQRYGVMRHTLAAAGIGVLYSVVFAATLYYTYLTKPMGFGLLALVSAAAFVLAVFYRSRAVSVLGAVGAYATPLLVSTGQGRLEMFFGYLVVVNAGLFLVARRLVSQGLLLVAAAGTAGTLGLASMHVFEATAGPTLCAVWILNLALFVFFLDRAEADPRRNQASHWTGIVAFGATLLAAAVLLLKPGWAALLTITAAQALALTLAWRQPGWYRQMIPYSALGFLVALVWVLLRFQPGHFSVGFPLLLLYGAFGGIGPLALVARHGLNRAALAWFRVFPLAVVLLSLAVVFQQPAVSFWFWPLLLGLEVIGIGISILFRALVQVGVLVLLFVLGALHWLFSVPEDLLGIARATIALPPAAYKRLRLRLTALDRRARTAVAPIREVAVTGTPAGKDYAVQTIALPFQRAETEGHLVIDAVLPGGGLHLRSVQVETEALFQGAWQLGRNSIAGSRKEFAEVQSGRAEHVGRTPRLLTIRLDSDWPGRSLVVKLEQTKRYIGAVTALRAEARLPRLVFAAEQPGRYTLLTGGGQKAPLLTQPGDVQRRPDREAAVTAIQSNPLWRPASLVERFQLKGAPFDAGGYTWRAPLAVSEPGYYRLALSLEAVLKSTGQPIRIVHQDRQVPYIQGSVESNRIDLPVSMTLDEKRNQSQWTIQLPGASDQWQSLSLHAEGLFSRRLQWERPKPGNLGWEPWRALQWENRDARETALRLDLSDLPPGIARLRATMDNGDNAPITVSKITARYAAPTVYFLAHAPGPYQLYGGNPQAAPPRYDLSLVQDQLLSTLARESRMGDLEFFQSPGWRSRLDAAFKDTGWGLYAVLAVVTLALIGVIVKLFPKTSNSE